VTARVMQSIDQAAVQRFGIPPIVLMENAAIASAFCVLGMLTNKQKRVLLFCGPGNNGGDGFACARHLLNHGLGAKVFFLGKKTRLSSEARINYEILRKMGQRIAQPSPVTVKNELSNAGVIVDALFGIGLKKSVQDAYYKLIKLINDSKRPILSLDVPSGLNATTGEVQGIAVRARRTVTFGLIKKGMLKPKARRFVGKITVADISLPRKLLSFKQAKNHQAWIK
ncbi:MAG: NAD(P)H-hydrate epimerase, partial [Candidatus Omnitrophica bacterium]|nr:NAD(P)H-hydrate epimerase [Candidatus Omnitrophota bacterium]